MTLLLVIAAAAAAVLLVTVCAVRSNRLTDEDERPSLWLVPDRDPEREQREHNRLEDR